MKKLKRKNLVAHNKVGAKSKYDKENITLDDLVIIFNEEAYKMCRNRQIAKLIALKTLQEYVTKNTKNLKIIL